MEPTNFTKHTSGNPIQQTLINNFYSTLFSELKKLKFSSVLDVGCGEGFTLKKMEDRNLGEKLVGIDILDEALKLGKKMHPQLDLRKGSIYKLPFKDNSFDVVMATEVLEHLEDPQKGLEELVRVSKKYVVVSVPNEPFFIMTNFLRGKYVKSWGNHPEHINHWTTFGIEKFMKNTGLKTISKKHPYAWTLVTSKKK